MRYKNLLNRNIITHLYNLQRDGLVVDVDHSVVVVASHGDLDPELPVVVLGLFAVVPHNVLEGLVLGLVVELQLWLVEGLLDVLEQVLLDVLVQVSHELLVVGVVGVLDLLGVVVGLVQHKWRVVSQLAVDVVELLVLGLVLDEHLEVIEVLEHLQRLTVLGNNSVNLWFLILLSHYRL